MMKIFNTLTKQKDNLIVKDTSTNYYVEDPIITKN